MQDKKIQNIKKRTLREDWKLILRGVRLCWQISPKFMVYRVACVLEQRISPYFATYMSALLVNELAGKCDPARLARLAFITVLGTLAISVGKSVLNGRLNIRFNSFRQRVELYIAGQQSRMQYEHCENPEVSALRENIALAMDHGRGLPNLMADALPELIACICNLAVSASLTFSMFRTVRDDSLTGFLAFINSPGSAVLLLLLIFLNVILSARIAGAHTAKLKQAWDPQAKINQFMSVYNGMKGTDVTIFNMRKIILKECRKALIKPAYLENVEKVRTKYSTLSMLQEAVLRTAIFVTTAAKAFIGTFGIGNFLLYKRTVHQFVGSVIGIANEIAILRYDCGYLESLYRYLDLPDKMYQGTLAVEKRDDIDYEIEFRNVSFRYPNTENEVLHNVSMKFKIGDKLAIVGENGSGKSTFIKLLCRLYDPTEGVILLNGIDITKYRYEEYIALFSVVFQDYTLFDFPLSVNVAASQDCDREKVRDCLERAGFGERLRGLEQGIDAVIGRRYEAQGIDLSGGEMQKVATARALYKDAPFVVLDEPTAALDPIAEAAVYENFQTVVEGKTTVVISHRLSSCRFCDDILVFDRGRIVQRGSHGTLASGEGKYRQLWNAQAQYYQSKEICN